MARGKRGKSPKPVPVSSDETMSFIVPPVKRRSGHLWTVYRPVRRTKKGNRGYRRHEKHREGVSHD